MPTHDPPSPSVQPAKRQRHSSLDNTSPRDTQPSPSEDSAPASGTSNKPGQSSNFRNVSACNRCRLRKNRCDQRLPSCASCAKAGVACVGYDPITKKEIPRSYVFYLETRVEQLETLLESHNIAFPPSENLELCSRPTNSQVTTPAPGKAQSVTNLVANSDVSEPGFVRPRNQAVDALNPKKTEENSSASTVASPSKPRSLASASGVSFARVVFAAVQYSVSDHSGPGERSTVRQIGGSGTSMRDSFFGLHMKPTIQPAPFPNRHIGLHLATLYFEHNNTQIPILHRGDFMQMFERAYTDPNGARGACESYMLNMVFAIGCGIIVREPVRTEASGDESSKGPYEPEEYHASAIVHLESCLSSSNGGLEVLQAVLLLANFALLRPVPPGLWYVIGVAMRLAVDLGLHHEDGMDVEQSSASTGAVAVGATTDSGGRAWTRDMKRRLWWCTYSFDRLVSTCVGRPFGISDQVITTSLPSLLDDEYITPTGFLQAPPDKTQLSYKYVAHHYFRLRTLQSEILEVLQYNQAQIARASSQAHGATRSEMLPQLHSPYLVQFDSFRSWRQNIDERLQSWKMSVPATQDTGIAFSTEFLELNYWQTVMTLYRQSLSVPTMFEGEYNMLNDMDSPSGKAFTTKELREDEEKIYLKVAEAGQKILRMYRQLHLNGLISYPYLSTHYLFMAGISYLYAIWHSPLVRSRLTMDEVDFAVLAAKSVFTDMIDKCPPAETCRDAFDRTARATIRMASSTGGFGPQAHPPRRPRTQSSQWASSQNNNNKDSPTGHQKFGFDISMSDTLTSPSLSTTNDMTSRSTPPQSTATDYIMMNRGSVESTIKSQSQEAVHPVTAHMSPHRAPGPGPGPGYMGQTQQYHPSLYSPDTGSMDFLQAAPNMEMGAQDQGQGQVDLGFGINWDGLPNDYGEGHQLNPFDTFFFGGQQATS